jgi:hypothetical protein
MKFLRYVRDRLLRKLSETTNTSMAGLQRLTVATMDVLRAVTNAANAKPTMITMSAGPFIIESSVIAEMVSSCAISGFTAALSLSDSCLGMLRAEACMNVDSIMGTIKVQTSLDALLPKMDEL